LPNITNSMPCGPPFNKFSQHLRQAVTTKAAWYGTSKVGQEHHNELPPRIKQRQTPCAKYVLERGENHAGLEVVATVDIGYPQARLSTLKPFLSWLQVRNRL
jgi:hypothetical protein